MSFKEYNQNQPFLLPPSLQEFISSDHLARVINDVVEEIDLTDLYRRYSYYGCNAFHPQMMLKVMFYAYATGERSSRKIAYRLSCDVAYMYLSALQKPDFRTINRFRKDNIDILKNLFVQIVMLCSKMGMVSIGTIAIDGTKLKANASYRNTKTNKYIDEELKYIDRSIARILKETEQVDAREDEEQGEGKSIYEVDESLKDKEERKKRLREAKIKLEEENKKEINLTDEDSATMLHQRHRAEPSYNGQIAVEEKSGIIVAADLTNNPADYLELKKLIKETEETTGKKPEKVLADSGYSCFDNLEYLETRQITGYMPDQRMESINKGTRTNPDFEKSNFEYNKEKDVYICPMGNELIHDGFIKRQGKPSLKKYKCLDCEDCIRQRECTKTKNRTISFDPRQPLMDNMRNLLKTNEGRKIYGKRKYMVESIFGVIKHNYKYRELLLRGERKAKGEFMIMCIAHNLKKIAKYLIADINTENLAGSAV